MKHLKQGMIFLVLAMAVMVVTEVEAGRIKKPKKGARTEKTEAMKQPAEFDKLPSMTFVTGVLSRDIHSGWKIGETPLFMHKGCTIYMEGVEEGFLEEGREAFVMGSMLGEAISAYSVRLAEPEFKTNQPNDLLDIMEPGEDPNVGRYTGPVD